MTAPASVRDAGTPEASHLHRQRILKGRPMTENARHETPDVAELRRRLDALPGFTLKHLHGGPGGESYIGLGDEGGMPLSDSGFDAVLFFAEIAALEVPRLLDRLAHGQQHACADCQQPDLFGGEL